jgi:hypothetical protein
MLFSQTRVFFRMPHAQAGCGKLQNNVLISFCEMPYSSGTIAGMLRRA